MSTGQINVNSRNMDINCAKEATLEGKRNKNLESILDLLSRSIHDKCKEYALKRLKEDDFIYAIDANINANQWDDQIIKDDDLKIEGIRIVRNSSRFKYDNIYSKKLNSFMNHFINLIDVANVADEITNTRGL